MTGKKSDKATWAKEKTAFKQHSVYLYRSRTGTIFFFNIKTLSLVVPFLMFYFLSNKADSKLPRICLVMDKNKTLGVLHINDPFLCSYTFLRH